MGMTGSKFMKVTKARGLRIAPHARERIEQHTGLYPTRALARALFDRSRQVRAEHMPLLGHRPAYGRRKSNGQDSWYFGFRLFGEELVAVIQRDAADGEFAWVTTYGATVESEHYQYADFELLAQAC